MNFDLSKNQECYRWDIKIIRRNYKIFYQFIDFKINFIFNQEWFT